MRVHMQHPAIVSRRQRQDTHPAFMMVRVTSTVDVADYALGDTQIAAILSHGAGDTTYRRIGDHLYKALNHMPAHALEPGSDIARTLVGRSSAFDFGSFMTVVENAALALASETAPGFENVAYVGRALSRRDKPSSGLTAQLKAFDKAPQMGMAAGDEELGEWSRRFGEFMENIALVDGVVHVRSFEPCYRINLRPPETRSLAFDRMKIMEKWLGGGRQLDSRYIPQLGSGWELLDNRYFSLNERDRAVELADHLGFTREWLDDSHPVSAAVVDPPSLSSDFIKEETYRLAVAALDVADTVANEIAGFSYSNATGRDALAARLDEIGAPERNLRALVETIDDSDENALDQTTKHLASTLMREGEILNPGTARRISSLGSALEFLDLRRDAMPVALLPAPRKMGS
ncbi:hypothetical protein HFN89_02170 [Rhizobium laguerreae]|nr:hypothetical protein [Rhizobium laguerreae]